MAGHRFGVTGREVLVGVSLELVYKRLQSGTKFSLGGGHFLLTLCIGMRKGDKAAPGRRQKELYFTRREKSNH
jgi:hypothetical protein